MTTLVVHTDGGSRGNPGPAATGVVFLKEGLVVKEFGRYLGTQTNNEAEYQAVIDSLDQLQELLAANDIDSIEWKLDSTLVVQQISKVWKIKEPRLATFAQLIWKELAKLSQKTHFSYVPRAQNALADAVVNRTLDSQIS